MTSEVDFRIAADGSWHYLGSPITRKSLVALFASVLRREEDGRYFLVTPVERVAVEVEDAPFLAVSMDVEGEGREQRIVFHSNLGESAAAGPDHPLRFEEEAAAGGLKPYVHIRDRLEALVTRALVHDLVELASEHATGGEVRLGVWSGGVFFPMGGAADPAP